MTDNEGERIVRLESAVIHLAAWLVEAQTGFGKRDADNIIDMIERSRALVPIAADESDGGRV